MSFGVQPMTYFEAMNNAGKVRPEDTLLSDPEEVKRILYGCDSTEGIVGAEINEDGALELFIEKEGTVTSTLRSASYFILSKTKQNKAFTKLSGSLPYQYAFTTSDAHAYHEVKRQSVWNTTYSVYNPIIMQQVSQGWTFFKGMKVSDVSLLSFDIETTGLSYDSTSKVLLIANTFRRQGKIERKMFCYDDYDTEAGMFDAWCKWVREKDPSLMVGHNVYAYDLPYMHHCAKKAGTNLCIGRNGKDIMFEERESKYRRDAQQYYSYNKAHIYGRQIVDTFFLSMKYDFKRAYPSYGLKAIIDHEGLQVKNRQFYNAATIKDNYTNGEQWELIKTYAKHDADDALALFDKMITAYFYLCPIIPEPISEIINTASGSQLNFIMLRSYMNLKHSIPEASEVAAYQGADVVGHPGIYSYCFKVDVASLYPSIMMQYQIWDQVKDPRKHFLKLVTYLTKERLSYKDKYEATEEQYYEDFSQALKIIINSMYGMLGARGLYNCPLNAEAVTRHGRNILQSCIGWIEKNNLVLVNGDTDSTLFCKKDQKAISEEERQQYLKDINALYPEKIKWTDDGYYKRVLVLAPKNYVLEKYTGKTTTKITKKGVSLKATTKEPALRVFIDECVEALMKREKDGILFLYHKQVLDILNLKDITPWCTKRTITSKVLNPKRTNEENVLNALEDEEYLEGDRVYLYFDKDGAYKLREHWSKDHDTDKLLSKVYATLDIFKNVLDVECFPNYTLKRNQEALERIRSYAI